MTWEKSKVIRYWHSNCDNIRNIRFISLLLCQDKKKSNKVWSLQREHSNIRDIIRCISEWRKIKSDYWHSICDTNNIKISKVFFSKILKRFYCQDKKFLIEFCSYRDNVRDDIRYASMNWEKSNLIIDMTISFVIILKIARFVLQD